MILSDPEDAKAVLTAPPDVLHPGEGAVLLEPIVGRHSVILLDEAPPMEQRKLLLPAFPGLDAQRQAVEHGVRVSGCTVHFVDETLDSGPIVTQRAVTILDTDTPDTLAARILVEEHKAYPDALALVCSGAFEIVGRRVVKKQ